MFLRVWHCGFSTGNLEVSGDAVLGVNSIPVTGLLSYKTTFTSIGLTAVFATPLGLASSLSLIFSPVAIMSSGTGTAKILRIIPIYSLMTERKQALSYNIN